MIYNTYILLKLVLSLAIHSLAHSLSFPIHYVMRVYFVCFFFMCECPSHTHVFFARNYNCAKSTVSDDREP